MTSGADVDRKRRLSLFPEPTKRKALAHEPKKNRKGPHPIFQMAFPFTSNKRSIEKCIKKVHAGLRIKYKKIGVLHAYKEEKATRKKLLRMLTEGLQLSANSRCYISRQVHLVLKAQKGEG
ncbi:MAG: hypothetical protein KJ936_03055 [Proteobacteria bacterium]|nr:hypothetical protein [Pseudomonadota bacterium]MBU2226639.1 hypothetical protein [Pseudomonadota bacterium]